MNIHSSNTIYVGNIQSIDDQTLREYFQRFGDIEEYFHNCTRAADEWLIDYRFIRFSSNTDINIFLTNKIDHTICRIRLDIHSYDAVFNEETRLISDRKLCIAHTNSKLDRNIIKKAFTRYGRILNCTCVSSGNGVEYVYIEFESINTVQSIISSNQNHFAGRTALAVKQPLRPLKIELNIKSNLYELTTPYQSKPNPLELLSQEQIKNLEKEYEIIIRKDFNEITYQIDKYLQNQKNTYEKMISMVRY